MKLYSILTIDEFEAFRFSHICESVSDMEFKNLDTLYKYVFTYDWEGRYNNSYKTLTSIEVKQNSRKDIYIHKFEDDWFIIKCISPDITYKCDQIDGVIQCLNDNFNPITKCSIV